MPAHSGAGKFVHNVLGVLGGQLRQVQPDVPHRSEPLLAEGAGVGDVAPLQDAAHAEAADP